MVATTPEITGIQFTSEKLLLENAISEKSAVKVLKSYINRDLALKRFYR